MSQAVNIATIVVICQIAVKANNPKELHLATVDAYAKSPEEAQEMAADMARRQTLMGFTVLGTKIHAINPVQALHHLQSVVPDYDNSYRPNHPNIANTSMRGGKPWERKEKTSSPSPILSL